MLALVVVIAAIAATTAAVVVTGSGHARPAATLPPVSHPAVAPLGSPPDVAWVDYQGQVHIGSLQTHQQRVVASGGGDATTPLLVSGRTLFWVAGGGIFYDRVTRRVRSLASGVMAYDTVTGRVRAFASGAQLFNAIDSTDVFVGSGDAKHLARYRLDGRLIDRFTLPNGWYLADAGLLGNPRPALAHGGILVLSQTTIQAETVGAKPSKLGVWTPATASLRPLGDVWKVVATYTDSRGAKSLVAWLPASCTTSGSCLLQLTDPATGATRQIRSPLGFDFGGAFSPDGRQLAAFARTNPGDYNPETRLALIDLATGSLRPVPGATISIGDSLAWAQWMPDSRQLIVGGVSGADGSGKWEANHFLVDSVTLRAAPFSFLADGQQDVNYSAVLLP
jgi:hypothetical protein